MNTFRSLLTRFFPPHQLIPAGLYTRSAPPDADFPYRLHLRIEPDGHGLLVVNGSTVVHLNQTAAEYAYHVVQGDSADKVAAAVSTRYGITREQAQQDYTQLAGRLRALVETPDLDPVTYLDFGQVELYSGSPSAPYRLDCALTYRQPESGYTRFVPLERAKFELSQPDWQIILKKAWDAGVPHVVFTGGEPTLRPDLPDLIGFASQLGMVTGLISNGLRLAEKDYLHQMLQNGLDHLMMVLDPVEDAAWEALRDCMAEDLAVVVHLTLMPKDEHSIPALLDRLQTMEVQAISVSASSVELEDQLPQVRQAIADRGLRLVWDLPVPYSSRHPVALELAAAGQPVPQGAGKAWLYVEPDGDVLPGQGILEVLGNLASRPWSEVWRPPAA
jgi:hypothetical protein